MDEIDNLAGYVEAACVLHQLSLTAEERVRVTSTMAITAQMVAPLMAIELPPDVEAAPVFKA